MTPNGRFELGKKASFVFHDQEDTELMVDMYRRLDFFPCWIMATSLGRTNWYVPFSIPASQAHYKSCHRYLLEDVALANQQLS